MSPNFTECGIQFQKLWDAGNRTLAYNGTIQGVLSQGDRPALITIAGCLELCGHGYELYTSDVWTNTVTNWVLPVAGGLLLQAPFESNRFWRTCFALMRWLGNPISSLSYVFWNIKVLGKCAMMVDMAVEYSDSPPETVEVPLSPSQTIAAPTDPLPREQSEFARMRDSFYLLSVMNQFNIPPILPNMSAEKLLRIALFSDTLDTIAHAHGLSLPKLREQQAKDLRSRRRRGTVPVFISVGWFLVSLAISINTAFGQLGGNATAHNLALGLMLGWLPVFVLACIVDRNPLNTNDVKRSLNEFLNVVRLSLIEASTRDTYIQAQGRLIGQLDWIHDLSFHQPVFETFFRDFAGQGRTRWHYGVAHSVLAAVEDVGVADVGRGWFNSLPERHDELVLGPENPLGLHYFDWRECWQIVTSMTIVFGTLVGAFVISFYTPTVGLGCRSGGYMIYFILTMFSFSLEMLVWFKLSTEYKGREAIHDSSRGFAQLRRVTTLRAVQPFMDRIKELSMQEKLDYAVFKPLDLIATAWLVYIVCAQTFGTYANCQCIGSTWGLGMKGGYVDFLSVTTYKAKGIITYWAAGTATSIAVLMIASVWVFCEWLTQSHLATENYKRAMRGLMRTRRWKRRTTWLRWSLLLLPCLATMAGTEINKAWYKVRPRGKGYVSHESQSLEWAVRPRRRTNFDGEARPLNRLRMLTSSHLHTHQQHSASSDDGVSGGYELTSLSDDRKVPFQEFVAI